MPDPPASKLPADITGAAFVARLLAEFSDWSSADLALLRLAGEALDRIVEVRAAIAKDGVATRTRRRVTPHPLLAAERRAVSSFATLVRQLQLKD